MVVSEKFLTDIHIEEPFEWDMRLAARATMDIKDLLEVIGHGVTVSSVRAREYDDGYAAAYFWDRRVIVDSECEFSDDTLLFVMGHECAHAMLVQGGFLKDDPSLAAYQRLAHEVAADVLGAHLAGRVVSRRGEDGAELTVNLLEETRIVGQSYSPEAAAVKKYIGQWLDPNCGAEKLIVATDRICRQHDDLWEAARAIANEIHNVDMNTAKRLAPARVFREKRERNDDE
jgi:hypothetical protein